MIEEQSFENIDFTLDPLPGIEYDNCTFLNCNLSGAILSEYTFLECVFDHCNLGAVKLSRTAFKDVEFRNCNLLGVDFSEVNQILLAFTFTACRLDLSSFYQLQIKGTNFLKCSIREADFIESNLTGAAFIECDLEGAIFENTVLEKVDFTSADNFAIDPESNRVEKAKFSITGLEGLLGKYNLDIE